VLSARAGSLSGEIAEFVKKNGLEGEIVLLGRVDYNLLCRLLKDANALLMPSICPENCPLITLEALSLGTPIIASNKGGLPEIVEKIYTGLVYNGTEELKQAMLLFNKAKYPSGTIKKIYEQNFT
jgi:glycosyltransferase involved in cell wall biosynthesis